MAFEGLLHVIEEDDLVLAFDNINSKNISGNEELIVKKL